MKRLTLLLATLSSLGASTARAQTTLGSFTFDNATFGLAVATSHPNWVESSWLSVNQGFAPGLFEAIAGANFDTGLANLGLSATPGPMSVTVFGGGIVNTSGDDFGIVVARLSSNNFRVRVVTLSTFSNWLDVQASDAVDTGVDRTYYLANEGPYTADLFVHSLDFSDFGLASGETIFGIEVESNNGLDFIRAAGFKKAAVPEPSTVALLVSGLCAAVGLASRRRKAMSPSAAA